jgi:hypothetical protein
MSSMPDWEFLQDRQTESWTWRRSGFDGAIARISEPFPNYGAVVVNAIKAGFCPKEHRYTVSTANDTHCCDPRIFSKPKPRVAGRARKKSL